MDYDNPEQDAKHVDSIWCVLGNIYVGHYVGCRMGTENGIMSGVKDFAHNSCYFFTNRTTVAYDGFRKGRWWSLHSSDMEVLKQSFPEIRLISPILLELGAKKIPCGVINMGLTLSRVYHPIINILNLKQCCMVAISIM